MWIVELLAITTTVACVLLAVKRSIWQFPVGITSTLLFLFVFWHAKLYSSSGLQIFFIVVQVYGWWYWLFGDAGKRPRITSWPLISVIGLCAAAMVFAGVAGGLLRTYTDAGLPFLDALIFGLSVAAQFLLDRKTIENWIVWGLVDAVSVGVYGAQHLWFTAALYLVLFMNTFWGYYEWRKELTGYDRGERAREA